MKRFAITLALLLAAILAGPSPAPAQNKIALVIGNDAYTQVTPLKRAVADARAYRKMLADERGFHVVYAENADRATMIAKIGEFLGKVRRDDIAMVVYSGHGVQLDPNRGDSLYLLPTDIPSVDPGAGGASFFMDSQAINFSRLSTEVAARGAGLRLFVIDACRNNPFPPAPGGRSIGLTRGLGNVRSSRGEFIFFAAAPGEVALDLLPGDDESENSVFTRVFLKHFRPGTYLEDVANDVQEEVLELSRLASYEQAPYYTDGVPGKTCIDRECGVIVAAAASAGDELEMTYWRLCETHDTPGYCEAYLETYPAGPHAPLANLRISELAGAALPGIGEAGPRQVTVGPASVTGPAAEPTIPQTGAARQPEPQPSTTGPTVIQPPETLTTQAQPTPEPPITAPAPEPVPLIIAPAPEPDIVVAAVTPAAPVTGVEEPRVPEFTRQLEAEAAWSQLKDTWDIRAVRGFKTSYPDAEQAAEADRRIAYLRQRHREAQTELNRLGYNAGPVDGDWGRKSARALRAFESENKLRQSGIVTKSRLRRLKQATPRVVAATPPATTTARSTTAPQPQPADDTALGILRRLLDPRPDVEPPPADDAKVATLTPATGGIADGEKWRATATTTEGSILTATMTRDGDTLKLRVKFDHRDNGYYYPWMIDRYSKTCSDSFSDSKFKCWFTGDVSRSGPSSPGGRIIGKFPRLRLEAHSLVGDADLIFRRAP